MTEFVIDVRDFDATLLPESVRTPGTDDFQNAVLQWFQQKAGQIGGSALVGVDDEKIIVQWFPDGEAPDPLEKAVHSLKEGNLEEGVSILETLAVLDPRNFDVRFNLGMALSDMGRLGEACKHLEQAVKLSPAFSHAWVGLGVAQQRMGDSGKAKGTLLKALEVDPADGYAHRNLGAVLMTVGETQEAGKHFREAARLLPDDPPAKYGLATWLIENGNEDEVADADDLLQSLIELLPIGHPIAALAKEQRSKIAMHNLRAAGGGLRMDAVMYILGAIGKFDSMDRLKVQEIGFEIAMMGQRGIDVNDSAQKYALRTLPGKYSGLHLMSLMYAAFQVLDPAQDIGFDLSAEYAMAKTLHLGGDK